MTLAVTCFRASLKEWSSPVKSRWPFRAAASAFFASFNFLTSSACSSNSFFSSSKGTAVKTDNSLIRSVPIPPNLVLKSSNPSDALIIESIALLISGTFCRPVVLSSPACSAPTAPEMFLFKFWDSIKSCPALVLSIPSV